MNDLRTLAKGRECQIRLPGICNGDRATTVLAHIRINAGIGRKPHDLIGSWACSACHDVVDGRRQTMFGRDELRLSHLEGMARTIDVLAQEGLIVKTGGR